VIATCVIYNAISHDKHFVRFTLGLSGISTYVMYYYYYYYYYHNHNHFILTILVIAALLLVLFLVKIQDLK